MGLRERLSANKSKQKWMTVDLTVSKKTIKKLKQNTKKLEKSYKIKSIQTKVNVSQRIIKQETGPHQLVDARPEEKKNISSQMLRSTGPGVCC